MESVPSASYPLSSLPADDLLRDLLAVSLTGVIYYTPIYGPAGEVVDFTFVYLNPTAQRMMAMPEVPAVTHRQQWPHSIAHGTFQFHVDAYVSGEPREYNVNYQADGYDNYCRLAARRSGAGLLVSFTDTADQPRTAVEVALREAQAPLATVAAPLTPPAVAAADTVTALPCLFAVRRQRRTLLAVGALGAANGTGVSSSSGKGFFSTSDYAQLYGIGAAALIALDLAFGDRYSHRNEARALADFQAHRLAPRLRRQLKPRYFTLW